MQEDWYGSGQKTIAGRRQPLMRFAEQIMTLRASRLRVLSGERTSVLHPNFFRMRGQWSHDHGAQYHDQHHPPPFPSISFTSPLPTSSFLSYMLAVATNDPTPLPVIVQSNAESSTVIPNNYFYTLLHIFDFLHQQQKTWGVAPSAECGR